MNEAAARCLSRYGYLDGLDDVDLSLSGLIGSSKQFAGSLSDAVSAFQSFYGLQVTGELDADTLANLVAVPRCTIKDLIKDPQSGEKVVANFSLGDRWEKNELTWFLTKGPANDLSDSQVRETLERAFRVWERVADLKFSEASGPPGDLEIRFESGEHGDGDAFDGGGGTLAHAFFPRQGRISGDIHFDDGENWTLGSFRGINLTQVAVHEIGHSLGLEHSNVRGAIMFPSYEGYRPDLELHKDDIRGIQTLYGPPQGEVPEPEAPEIPWEGGGGGGREMPPLPGILSILCRLCGLMWAADYRQA